MYFRKATQTDINGIMEIITQAQGYLKQSGVDQWQNNYPNAGCIENDIMEDISYVLVDNDTITATAALSFKPESTYDTIYEGSWITNGKYAVIHRIAVRDEYKGRAISSRFLENMEALCLRFQIYQIKIDTHRDNAPMQRFLNKNGFKYCGIIYLADKNERFAFEKSILTGELHQES